MYKAVFSLLATPERYARHGQRLWDLHYDSGTTAVEISGPRRHVRTISGWRGHHRFICMLNMRGGASIYGAMGCVGVRCQVQSCVADGDDACTNVVTWEG